MKKALSLCLLACQAGFAQAADSLWTHYTHPMQINCLADEDSLLWIGTASGLVRYRKEDGATTIYTTANSGIVDNQVLAVSVDSEGGKWIGTGRGACALKGSVWSELKFPKRPISGICRAGDGKIWAGISGSQVEYKYKSTGLFSLAADSLQSATSISVTFLSSAAKGGIWYSGRWHQPSFLSMRYPSAWAGTGLYASKGPVSRHIFTVSPNHPFDFMTVHAVSFGQDGEPEWVGTAAGLAKVLGDSLAMEADVSGFPIKALAKDSSGLVWTGSEKGLHVFDGSASLAIEPFPSRPLGRINALLTDKTGRLWAGSQNGLATYRNGTWTRIPLGSSGPPPGAILSVAIDSSGAKWFGTASGLHRFDGKDWTEHRRSPTGLPSDTVWGIWTDKEGSLWMRTGAPGLSRYSRGEWTRFDLDEPALTARSPASMSFESNGTKWCASQAGVFRFDGTKWVLDSHEGSPRKRVAKLAHDRNGMLWAITDSLHRYDGESWRAYAANVRMDFLAVDDLNAVWTFGSDAISGPVRIFSGSEFLRLNAILKNPGPFERDCGRWYSFMGGDPAGRILWGELCESVYGADSGMYYVADSLVTKIDFPEYKPLSTRLYSMAVDRDGSYWFGFDNGVAHYTGTFRSTRVSGISRIPVDSRSLKWRLTGKTLTLLFNGEKKADLTIRDLRGKTVLSRSLSGAGRSSVTMDLTGIRGVHSIEIRSPGRTPSRRVVTLL